MKYRHLLSISVSTGILLCVWAFTEKSTTIGRAADVTSPTASASPSPSEVKGPVQDAGPFTNYVKHNPGAVTTPSPVATASANPQKTPHHPKVTSWFYAQLVSNDNGTTGYIRYSITDQYGIPTEWHSINSTDNKSPNSTLFHTTFDFNAGITVSTSGGEVTITGTGTNPTDPNPKTYMWKSHAYNDHTDDGDVTWTP
jgi:hypothetical protein